MHRLIVLASLSFIGCGSSGSHVPAPPEGPTEDGLVPAAQDPIALCSYLTGLDEMCDAYDEGLEPGEERWCKCEVEGVVAGQGELAGAAWLSYFGGSDLGPTVLRDLILRGPRGWMLMQLPLTDDSTGDGGRFQRRSSIDKFAIDGSVLVAEVQTEEIDFYP